MDKSQVLKATLNNMRLGDFADIVLKRKSRVKVEEIKYRVFRYNIRGTSWPMWVIMTFEDPQDCVTRYFIDIDDYFKTGEVFLLHTLNNPKEPYQPEQFP